MEGNPAYLSRILTGATYLINTPVLKEHFEAGLTFALKNQVGSVDNAKSCFMSLRNLEILSTPSWEEGSPNRTASRLLTQLRILKKRQNW